MPDTELARGNFVQLNTMRLSNPSLFAIIAITLLPPAGAATVHKWVDGNGTTHYSDAAPVAVATDLVELQLPAAAVSPPLKNDYYSIANQWQRMHRESIEREKLQLQQQQASAQTTPRVVYVEKPEARHEVSRYVVAYPRSRRHRHIHRGDKSRHYYASGQNQATRRPPVRPATFPAGPIN